MGRHSDPDLIRVSVRLVGDVRRLSHEPPDGLVCELPAGAAIAELLAAVGIPADEELVIGVNGVLAARDTKLQTGDHVLLVTPMAGG